MLRLKEFNTDKIVFTNDNNNEFVLTADSSKNQEFDLDIIEDILDWAYRTEKNVNK